MSGRLPYVKRRKYPHLIQEETDVWNRFVDKFPKRYKSVDYDFRVGNGQIPPEGYTKNYERMVTMLTQHRIDVLAWVGDYPTIIEVKNRAILSTVGQLIGYRTLFEADFPNLEKPGLLCVCASISDDVKMVFDVQGIPVEVV